MAASQKSQICTLMVGNQLPSSWRFWEPISVLFALPPPPPHIPLYYCCFFVCFFKNKGIAWGAEELRAWKEASGSRKKSRWGDGCTQEKICRWIGAGQERLQGKKKIVVILGIIQGGVRVLAGQKRYLWQLPPVVDIQQQWQQWLCFTAVITAVITLLWLV